MRDVKNAKTDKKISEKKLASVSAVSTDSDSDARISLKTKKDIKNQYKKAEKIKHHYFRTFYYSFAITFIVLGSLAILYFMYQQDKNVFGFADKYYEQAVSYIESGNRSQAVEALNECLEFDPGHTEARLLLAQVYEDLTMNDEAVKVLTDGIEISPRNETFYQKKIQLLTKSDRITDAMDFINSISSSYIIVKLSETRPATVAMSPDPGTYDSAVRIELVSSVGATIYYTLDGSSPTTKSRIYDPEHPIFIEKGTVTIRAFAMNNQNMISDEYSATYRIYSANSPYIFRDDKVEQMVRTSINKPTGTIYYRDLQNVKRLSSEEKGDVKYTGNITTLADLIEMVNLNEVILVNEPYIEDFSPLLQLKSMTSLNVSGCELDDEKAKQIFTILWLNILKIDNNLLSNIENVRNMSVLREFSAAGNALKDVSVLGNMTLLRSLNLSNNLINDISSFSNLTSLKILDISNNLVSDISPLSYLTMLTDLNIATNSIKQLNAISRLQNLETLILSNNPIQYLLPIEDLTSLKTLKIDGTNVTTVAALSELINLESLDCSRTSVTDFSALSKMRVKTLVAAQANITDVNVIAAANSIRMLDLSLNNISDVSPLSTMTNLNILNISNNPVANFGALQLCTTLESITCAGVPITSADESLFSGTGIRLIK
ncbi:MAG: leucine-rich repeat domain-containing protein [Clostridia bacterium]|nr:leucine-rich repeat domain-containing protein [Clostridia bacterium]